MMKARRRPFAGDLDSRSAIDTALHGCDTSFPASLFRSKTSGQVLYLEAGKDLVDTLLSFVHMTSTGVPQEQHYGAISNIYKSVEKLESEVLHVDRNCILAPPTLAVNNLSSLSKASTSTWLLHLCQDANTKRPSPPQKKPLFLTQKLYECYHCKSVFSESQARCYTSWPENGSFNCNCKIREGPYNLSAKDVQRQKEFVAEQEPVEEYNRATGPGFVKENIPFLLSDKLEIMPSGTIEIMSVLKEMKVNSLFDLESKKIAVTIRHVIRKVLTQM